jgi:hypothetical protein
MLISLAMATATERVTIPLRISPELHARLKDLAAKDERSLNAFIAFGLARLVAVSSSQRQTVLPGQAVALTNAYSSGAKTRKVGPNVLCPCGSGTKYKRCHGRGT